MEDKNELIREFIDAVSELEENEYIWGIQGKPPLYLPLPESDNIVKPIRAINRVLEQAHAAGQNREPYKLRFSGKHMAGDGVIEKSSH